MTATATAGAAAGEAGPREGATRSPWLPCLVAWLLPGAGHILLGRLVPGVVFAAVILTSFGFGLGLSGTVYAMDPEQPLSYLATLANVGVGPLDLWARARTFGELRYRVPDSRSDAIGRERVLKRTRALYARAGHAYGRTFLLTAGLMNLLLVLDVYDYCVGRKTLRPTHRPPPESGAAA